MLIVPATAMGATFPVVVGALSAGRERFGVALGRLYGWNTLGAVAGVVAAELILVDRFGVAGAAWTARGIEFDSGRLGDVLLRDALQGVPYAMPEVRLTGGHDDQKSRPRTLGFLRSLFVLCSRARFCRVWRSSRSKWSGSVS